MKTNKEILDLVDELAMNVSSDFRWSEDLRNTYESICKQLSVEDKQKGQDKKIVQY